MKCEEFEERLNLVLDERRRPGGDDELRLHSEGCPVCRELSAAYERLLDGFYALTTPELPADLSTRVLDEIKVRPAGRRRAAIVSAILATAAAVAVAVYLPGRQGTDAVPKVAQAEHLALVTKTDPAAAATRQSGANDVAVRWRKLDEVPLVGPMLKSMSDKDKNTDPYEALAKGTGQSLASVVLYMPGIGPNGFISPARKRRQQHRLARAGERGAAARGRVDDRNV